MLFKTLSITSRYKMPLEDYKEHFEGWLKDLKKTGGYWPIVERHETQNSLTHLGHVNELIR